MSSRERMLATLKRQPHDHVPFSPYIGQGPWWPEPLFWRGQLERAERMLELGLDPAIDVWLPSPEPHPDVKIKTWRDTTSGAEPMLTKEYHTPAGVLRQTVSETDDWCSSWHCHWIPTTFSVEKRNHYNMELIDDFNIPRRTEPWVKGIEDLEKLRYLIRLPEGHVLDEWRMDAQRAKEFAEKHGLLLQSRRTIVGDAFQWFCDISDFAVWMIEKPEFVKEFLGIFQEWALGLTKLALETGVDVVQRRGWYEIPAFWGPKYFKEYLVPLIEEETRLVHDAGKIHCYLLPEGQGAYASVLKDMSVDVLMGIDPRMLHGGDMISLYERLGEHKAFWGGVNAEVTLESGDTVLIDKAVKEAIGMLGGRQGFILGAFLFQQITAKSILSMIDAWKKYRQEYS